jgi:hypothetical protein
MEALTPDVLEVLSAIFALFFNLGASGIVQAVISLFVQLLGLGL